MVEGEVERAKHCFAPPNGCTGKCTPDFERSMECEALKGGGDVGKVIFYHPHPNLPPLKGEGGLIKGSL